MNINITKIYSALSAKRDDSEITIENQQKSYLVNVMAEIGKLSENIKQDDPFGITLALCEIAIYTIDTFDYDEAPGSIGLARNPININEWLSGLLLDIGRYSYGFDYEDGYNVLSSVVELCRYYGFDFELVMLEVIAKMGNKEYKVDFEKAKLKN